MSFTIDLDTALSLGRAVFLVFSFVLAAVAFARWRRALSRDKDHLTTQLSAMTERLGEIEAGLALLDSRIAEINRSVAAPHKGAPLAAPASGAPSYPIAIRLARNGASLEELMEGCGLARQEAELVKRLHGPAKRAPRAQTAAA